MVTHTSTVVSGVEPGQRHLNGPQTSGRGYTHLSGPVHHTVTEFNVAVPTADGTMLLADITRPNVAGPFPVLVSASAYPRQIQTLGAPLGFIEAGQSDFFAPRGYVHVVANVRGTNGSGGTWTFADAQERQDLHDLVEWSASQPWSTSEVGMIGISYFAITQLAAAVTLPPHLKAVFPVAVSSDLYDLVYHNGLLNQSFISGWATAVAVAATRSEKLLRGPIIKILRTILDIPRVHARMQHVNGEAALAGVQKSLRGSYPEQPWDQIWADLAINHPFRDRFWADRSLMDSLTALRIPIYLGCDWDNSPVHLPSTFDTWQALQQIPDAERPPVRMTLLGNGGLSWPWDSLHVEALAWFDHFLKHQDTGILAGPPIRYWLPEADQWRTAETWPPPESTLTPFTLQADGALTRDGATGGSRQYLAHGEQLARPRVAHQPTLPATLTWTTPTLAQDLDFAGDIELVLDASITGCDTGWIVALQDIDDTGTATFVTPGWLRAVLRAVDEHASRPGRPVLPCTTPQTVPPGQQLTYRIPLVPNARRIKAGHRLAFTLGSSDRAPGGVPAPLGFQHLDIGEVSVNTVLASSTLLLPVLPAHPQPAADDSPAADSSAQF